MTAKAHLRGMRLLPAALREQQAGGAHRGDEVAGAVVHPRLVELLDHCAGVEAGQPVGATTVVEYVWKTE